MGSSKKILLRSESITHLTMKKTIYSAAILFLSAVALISCRETEKETETIVREVEVQTETTTEEAGGILERAGEKVDGEVNEKIDDQIDRIGDDN